MCFGIFILSLILARLILKYNGLDRVGKEFKIDLQMDRFNLNDSHNIIIS